MEFLSFALSTIGLIAIIISFMVKGKNMKLILALNVTCNLMVGLSYIVVGNWNGTLSCAVGAAQGIVNYFFSAKNKPIPKWLLGVYAAAFVGVNLLVFTDAVDLIAIAACLTAVFVISATNGKSYRAWACLNNALWCTFDIFRGTYGPLLTHVVMLVFTLVGMLVNDRKKAK